MKDLIQMNIQCVNCGMFGHSLQKCKYPVVSYGIILYDMLQKQYLMICRSKSFGYIEFLSGNYSIINFIQIQYLIDEMSMEEKTKLLTWDFSDLWMDMWKKPIDEKSMKKFNYLKSGPLQKLMEESTTRWETPEWEFPKGRKRISEKMIDCAIREFVEETGFAESDIKIIDNVIPYEEVFVGSNIKSYKHKYYLAVLVGNKIPLNAIQYSEISKISWLSYEESLDTIRDYSIEKKKILCDVNKLLCNCKIII
jgi:ADP-ribose pyrophosphatase YjhB (NUDIX family)